MTDMPMQTALKNSLYAQDTRTKKRSLPNLQRKRFWVESENRWVRLRVSAAGIRVIDHRGIEQVIADLRARGEKI